MNNYIERVIKEAALRNPCEPEFIQTVEEVFRSIENVIDKHPEYEANGILERLIEPDRSIEFRVTWLDDQNKVHVNRGYRVQFNNTLGPYKGGLRFHPSVTLGTIKFLGFEQVFKNALTSLPLGGGKGGSNFDPRGKSDREIMNFCQSFMTELHRHIGPDIDIPAGDIGVGSKEIGYLYGQYKRIRGAWENGAITGKGLNYGGSLIRPQATGYGAIYYTEEVLKYFGDTIKDKTFALSGFGNVAWGCALKITELGGKVLTLSGPDGYIYDEDGVNTEEKINYMREMRLSGRDMVSDYANKFNVPFYPNKKPWGVQADIAMPCATQNEVDITDAEQIIQSGTKYYIEVSNMPTTNKALAYLQDHKITIAPSKAANAGGVTVSALEMCQNAARHNWSQEKIDTMLKTIMKNIHDCSMKASQEYGLGYDLVSGANIVGFIKVAETMLEEGFL